MWAQSWNRTPIPGLGVLEQDSQSKNGGSTLELGSNPWMGHRAAKDLELLSHTVFNVTVTKTATLKGF